MATLEELRAEYQKLGKKDLLEVCEYLNIDIIWKAWKDDIIRTIMDVQEKHANEDPEMNKPGFLTLTQFISGYESLEPLPTAEPRSARTDRYKLVMKNDLIARCKKLRLKMGWEFRRDDIIEAILNAEDQAGGKASKVRRIKSRARPIYRFPMSMIDPYPCRP